VSAEAAPSGLPVRRWPRRVAYGMAGLAVLLPSGTAGACWYFAAQVVSPGREYPLLIKAVDGAEVTLPRTEDTEREIPLGLGWVGGHAQLGEVVRCDRATVVRKLAAVTRGSCRAGLRAFTTSFYFDGDPRAARGLDFADVRVPAELGELPAWLVPGTDPTTWVIAVHGHRANRGEALRALPTLAATGATTLVISYRNDEGAPPSADRCYHLGDTEWRDVMSAVEFARTRGATRIVLYGWSMGGAIVLNALRRAGAGTDGGDLPDLVGVVLDSPVVDWVATLRMQAVQRRVPAPLTWSALRLVEQRIGVRLPGLDFRRYELPVPALVYLDSDDTYVATGPTREFADFNASTVRLVESSGGGHVRSWNVAPERYETELAAFLTSLPRS